MIWWRQWVTLPPRRSCKDHLHPCAVPELVPSAGFDPASSVLQTEAITRFANWANGADDESRTRVTALAPRYSAFELRPRRWWATGESNAAWHSRGFYRPAQSPDLALPFWRSWRRVKGSNHHRRAGRGFRDRLSTMLATLRIGLLREIRTHDLRLRTTVLFRLS